MSFGLLILGVSNTWTGLNYIYQASNFSQQEQLKSIRELRALSPFPLDSLPENMRKILSLYAELGELNIKPVEKSDLPQTSLSSPFKVDRLGRYQQIHVVLKGDYIEQINFLKVLEKNYRQFVFIQRVQGDGSALNFDARVYGA